MPSLTHQLLQAGPLIETERRHGGFQPVRMRHELPEDQIFHETEPGTLFPFAGEFRHQFPGIDSARAGRGARLAVEAERQVLKQQLRLVQFSLLHLPHESYPSPGRRRFKERLTVGRTRREAHAAAHAVNKFYVIHNWPSKPTGNKPCNRDEQDIQDKINHKFRELKPSL